MNSSSKGLRSRETWWTGKTIVTGFCVLAAVDSIMSMASIRNLFALINVFAGDAITGESKWTPATLEGAIDEAGALCARKAWVGETTVCRDKE